MTAELKSSEPSKQESVIPSLSRDQFSQLFSQMQN
jgi:hypothetical protein